MQDLIDKNIHTHVIVDAVSSGNQINRFSAFRYMEKIGANLITSGYVLELFRGVAKNAGSGKNKMTISPPTHLIVGTVKYTDNIFYGTKTKCVGCA